MPGGWDGVRNMIRQNQTSMPILNNAPLILSEVLLFPYLSGAEHIRQFKTRVPGGWPFDSLPESTEQIMHADKYFGTRDHPTKVTLPPIQGGAKLVYESDLGEFEMKVLLYQLTRDQASATLGASGWDGDQYALVSVGGSDGLVWATVWDSPLDAAEFVDVLGAALPNRYRGMKLTSGQAEVRRYEGGGRTIELRPVTIDGRPVVLFTDIPAGAGLPLADAARIRLSQ
jgi:hypothetical protein